MVNKRKEENNEAAELHVLEFKSWSQHPAYRKCLPPDYDYLTNNASNVLCSDELYAQIGLWL